MTLDKDAVFYCPTRVQQDKQDSNGINENLSLVDCSIK